MLDPKREEFFKHLINDHIFADFVDEDGWRWFGEHKYKAFGKEHEVLVEVDDADHNAYAYSFETYENMFKCWSGMFQDWLLEYDYFGDELWKVTLMDVMKLKKYGYLNNDIGKLFVKDLIEDLY